MVLDGSVVRCGCRVWECDAGAVGSRLLRLLRVGKLDRVESRCILYCCLGFCCRCHATWVCDVVSKEKHV